MPAVLATGPTATQNVPFHVIVVALQLFSDTKKSDGWGNGVVCSRCVVRTVVKQRR